MRLLGPFSKKNTGTPSTEAVKSVEEAKKTLNEADKILTQAMVVAQNLKEQREINGFSERFRATIRGI